MKKDDVWPSKWLKASDFPEPCTLTIKQARLETLKNKNGEDEKLCVYFRGEDKGLALNRVNFDSICDITGEDDSDSWPGHAVTLFATTTVMNGDSVACVRIRRPEAAKATVKKPAAAKPKPKPLADDLNDEIAF